jgi:hypothetical protein
MEAPGVVSSNGFRWDETLPQLVQSVADAVGHAWPHTLADAGAIATVVYTVLTFFLLRQTIEVRREEHEPSLDIYTAPNEAAFIVLDVIIKNSGGGAARDITFRFEGDIQGLKDRNVDLPDMALFRGLPYLAPGQALRTDMGTSSQFLGGEKPIGRVSIHASYRSDRNRRYEREFPLMLAEYEQMSQVQDSDRTKVVQSLETLAKAVGPWPGSNYLQVQTRPVEEPRSRAAPNADVQPSEPTRSSHTDRRKYAAVVGAALSAAMLFLRFLRK